MVMIPPRLAEERKSMEDEENRHDREVSLILARMGPSWLFPPMNASLIINMDDRTSIPNQSRHASMVQEHARAAPVSLR
jgi:hypothetical protein